VTEGAGEVTQGLIPVRDPGREKPEEGIALRLSGGGYRAMLFHLGGIIRLNETGHLKEIARVSSVSGGSITAGVLGLASKHLDFGIGGIASNLDELVVKPVRKLAGKTIDNPAIIWGPLLPWRTASGMLASYYAEYLFGGRTVQDLSDDSKGEGSGSCSTRRTCRRESSSGSPGRTRVITASASGGICSPAVWIAARNDCSAARCICDRRAMASMAGGDFLSGTRCSP